jgi:hypothetical protein
VRTSVLKPQPSERLLPLSPPTHHKRVSAQWTQVNPVIYQLPIDKDTPIKGSESQKFLRRPSRLKVKFKEAVDRDNIQKSGSFPVVDDYYAKADALIKKLHE